MSSCLTVVAFVAWPLQVIFAPRDQNNVGIFDAATSQFSTVATTGAAATGTSKYSGAGVVGTKVRASLSCCHALLLCVSIAMLAPPPLTVPSTLELKAPLSAVGGGLCRRA